MPHTLNEVRNVSQQCPLVLHCPRHTLRDLDGSIIPILPNIPLLATLTHSLDGPHPSITLESHPILIKVLARRLVRSGKHTPHHNAGGSQCKGLGDVSRGFNPPIGEDGDAILPREFGHVKDRRGLRTSHRTYLLRGADGSDAHAHSKSVGAGLYEMQCLGGGDDIPGDDLQFRMGLLEMLDNFDLIHGIALGGIDHDDVYARLDQGRGTIAILRPGTDGRPHQQLLGHGILARIGEFDVLQ
mmetsp:Transcript_28660/g.60493  ORF Transcript_28660/g.60493 Transcript_28660/m.60493 type:complete len:242 (-) Transcript_28660:939-1664(-)